MTGRQRRTTRTWRTSALAVAMSLVAVSCGDDGETASEEPEAPPAEWPTFGMALDNSRAAVDESVVGTDNVADLAPIWEVPDLDGFSGTPVIDDGVLYGGDWLGNVWARDPETGDLLWEEEIDGTNVRTAVALDDERVYVGTFGAQFAALDRESGDVLWEIPLDEHPMSSAFSAPIYVDGDVVGEESPDGLVIVGVGSYENMVATADEATFRGSVMALDPESGDEVWRYWTTTGDEEEGAGVGVWTTPAVDTERGHLYFGTGQHHAEPTSDRSDAVISLDVATGEEQWVYQYIEGDTWTAPDGGMDLDVSTPPNLFEVEGKDAVGAGNKDGTYKAIDRESGDELWSTDLTDGGPQGGAMNSAAVADGTIYVNSNDGGTNALLFALDADTGQELWSSPLDAGAMGPVTWANGVVYTTDQTGAVTGFDAENGDVLWTYQMDAESGAGVSVVDGTVYVGYGWWLVGRPEDAKGGVIAFRPGGGEDAPDADGTPDEELDAAAIFGQRCASCHGNDGSGNSGPALTDVGDRLSPEEQTEIISEGVGEMPAWEDTLSEEEIADIIDYLRDELAE